MVTEFSKGQRADRENCWTRERKKDQKKETMAADRVSWQENWDDINTLDNVIRVRVCVKSENDAHAVIYFTDVRSERGWTVAEKKTLKIKTR